MAVAESLLALAREEMTRQGCRILDRVCVTCGVLSGIVPESLDFCFMALVRDSAHPDTKLEIVMLPLRLRCSACGQVFGGDSSQNILYQPCPKCGETFGHIVEQGKELLLSHLEAH